MLRGLYAAASGMMTEKRKHDIAANNIANINTPGFKGAETAIRSFPEMLIALRGGGEQGRVPFIGRLHTGVFAEETPLNFSPGGLQETRQPYDFAIVSQIEVPGVVFDASGKGVGPNGEIVYQPQAFFTVADADGEIRYTRDGNFTINPLGELVTQSGYRVLDQNGDPIVLANDIGELKVTSNGFLYDGTTGMPVENAFGEPIQMLISRVDNPNRLILEGNGVFRLDDPDNPAQPVNPEDQVQILQGWIERSNVDPIRATVQLLSALRAYEANQKVVQFYDQSLDKAVNVVGKISV